MYNTLTLTLFNGSIGQEIFFICTKAADCVRIQGVSSNLVTTGAGNYTLL